MWIGKNRLHVNWRCLKSDQKIVSSIKRFMLHRGDVINKQDKTKKVLHCDGNQWSQKCQ